MGNVASTLAARGIEIDWFTSRFHHFEKRDRTVDTRTPWRSGIDLHFLDGPGYSRNLDIRRVIHQHAVGSHFQRYARTLPKPDLVLACFPSPELCYAAAQYCREQNVPLVVDVRDPWPNIFYRYLPLPARPLAAPIVWYYRKLLGEIMSIASGAIAMSHVILDLALSHLPRGRRIPHHVFYLGCGPIERRNRLDSQTRFSQAQPLRCIFSGTFGRSYNIEFILEAARIVHDAGEQRIVFDIPGSGDTFEHYRAAAQDLGNVHFPGWLKGPALKELLGQSHVGLVPITGGVREYWLGNKFFEYLAAGLAIASTATGEIQSLISRHSLGESFDNTGAENFAKWLIDLANHPPKLSSMMDSSAMLFEREMRAELIYEAYANFLCEIMKQRCTAENRHISSIALQ